MEHKEPTLRRTIAESVENVLERGAIAALVTLIQAAQSVGVKLLVEESGAVAGSLGSHDLDNEIIRFAKLFLDSRDEAHMFSVGEFAPQLSGWAETRVLIERIEPEPRIVICGAGHVGASLARLANL